MGSSENQHVGEFSYGDETYVIYGDDLPIAQFSADMKSAKVSILKLKNSFRKSLQTFSVSADTESEIWDE